MRARSLFSAIVVAAGALLASAAAATAAPTPTTDGEVSPMIVGDQFYGSTINPINRLGLHAKLLGFTHPSTGKRMTFTAPVPKSFRDLFAK